MKKFLPYLFALLTFSACLEKEELHPVADNNDQMQVPEKVHVISNTEHKGAIVEIKKDRITLQATNETQSFAIGDFVASGVTDKTPYGLLKKITDISKDGSVTTLSVENTSLGEVFESQHVDKYVNQYYSVENVDQKTLNVEYLGNGRFELKKEIVEGAFNSKISLIFKPEFEFEWIKKAGSQSPQVLKMATKLNIEDFTVTGTYSQAIEHRIATIELPPVTVNLGIPIVFKNSLYLDLSTSVVVQSDYDAGLSVENSYLKAGVAYYDGYGWYNTSTYDFGNVQPFRPENTGYSFNGNMVFPKLTLEASPYGISAFNFYGLAEFNSNVDYKSSRNPNLNIFSFVRCEAGINAKLWSIIDENYSYDKSFEQWTLFSGSVYDLPSVPGIHTTPETGRFDEITDIPNNHWAYNELKYLINHYLAGYPDNTFKPENQLTRAEFAAMVVAILDPDIKPEYANRTFTDISGHWAQEAILQAARAGYLAGFPDGTFRPHEKITRLHLLISLSNGLNQTGGEYDQVSSLIYDSYAIPGWAEQAVANAATSNMIVNYPSKNYLKPNNKITRAEAVAIFYRGLVYEGYFINPFTSQFLL
ncbi:MAG: S-layer homology domain-containing protein [Salinivirgaceae bacterium]|jgi:hypothetical protein|nr:S-layer homology domain-containing protein [Salinivirgaceae bacterium]